LQGIATQPYRRIKATDALTGFVLYGTRPRRLEELSGNLKYHLRDGSVAQGWSTCLTCIKTLGLVNTRKRKRERVEIKYYLIPRVPKINSSQPTSVGNPTHLASPDFGIQELKDF
jgi:hypothetical protein